jgi:hypothetical protein
MQYLSAPYASIHSLFSYPSVFTRCFILISALVLSIINLSSIPSAQAQTSLPEHAISASLSLEESQKQALTDLTQALIAQGGSSHDAAVQPLQKMPLATSALSLQDDLLTIAQLRYQLLTSRIEEHPEEVLRVAIASDVRANLPPAVQAYVEEKVEREGELEIAFEDYEDGSHRLLYSLKVNEERLSLHFIDAPSTALQTGSLVRIKGVQVGEVVALAAANGGVQALTASALSSFGEQRVLVMLVNFQNDPQDQPVTVEFARAEVFDKTDRFFRENSHGQTWLTGDIFGWHTIPLADTICDYHQLATLARQAAANAGFDLSAYNRYVYGFPHNACNWAGRATPGGSAWINGPFGQRIISHELGHTFGLYHSHAYECGATTLGDNCATLEYADYLDTMGFGPGHYNAFQKERLGWLPDVIHTVTGSGVYELDLYETAPGPEPKVLKIQKTPGQWYYIEYRQPIGFDGFLLSNDNVRNGVVIHTGADSSGNSSYLLDMTPETTSWYDPALEVGQSFTDPDAGVTITPLEANSSSVRVFVSLSAQPCIQHPPSVTLAPSAGPAVLAGATVQYTVALTNNDSPECALSNFTLQVNTPDTDWTATFSAPILQLGPGADTATSLHVTSPAVAPAGAYLITVNVMRSAAPGSEVTASATYTVAPTSAPGAVSVTTDKANYVAREWVMISARVLENGAPIRHVEVSFTVKKPDGRTVKQKRVTNKQGVAVYRFQLLHRDPLGFYHVMAQVSPFSGGKSSTAATSAETSFTVR